MTAFTLLLPALAAAQAYPSRPIRLIVPFPPAGTIDMLGRMVSQGVGDRTGQTMMVDNRAGAGGILGADLVAKAAPDSYTLCLCSAGSMISSPLFVANPPYDGLRDFAPVSMLATVSYLLLVRNGSGLNTAKDMLAQAWQQPGTLNYGSAGSGSSSHLGAAMFASMAGIQVVHVPYKGSAPAATDLIGGQIHFVFEAIGVSTLKRSTILPKLPSIAEQGVPGYEMSTWHTVCVTRGTPAAIVNQLNREIVAVINTPEVRSKFAAAGTEPQSSTPEQLAVHIAQEFLRWEKLLLQFGLSTKSVASVRLF